MRHIHIEMAAARDIFSKALPNVKLATRFDAEGREVQVNRKKRNKIEIKTQRNSVESVAQNKALNKTLFIFNRRSNDAKTKNKI